MENYQWKYLEKHDSDQEGCLQEVGNRLEEIQNHIKTYGRISPNLKQDPLDVQLYLEEENIQLQNIPDQMYGGALLVAKSRK